MGGGVGEEGIGDNKNQMCPTSVAECTQINRLMNKVEKNDQE